jgi:hypothetical protein
LADAQVGAVVHNTSFVEQAADGSGAFGVLLTCDAALSAVVIPPSLLVVAMTPAVVMAAGSTVVVVCVVVVVAVVWVTVVAVMVVRTAVPCGYEVIV